MTSIANEPVVAIRAPEPRDYPRMAELAGQLSYESSAEEISHRLSGMRVSPDHAVFVAERADGEIVGWIGVFMYRSVEADPRTEISGLVVDERMRSLGTGRRLVERAEEWAREKGCEAVSVRSNVIRDRAHSFYERLGYKNIKTQKSFRKVLAGSDRKPRL
jgi:GNAT superfamily N-acetyltransferase